MRQAAEVVRYEVGSQLRRASTWIYFAILLGLALAVASSLVDDARKGELFFNAPIVVAAVTVLSTLLGLAITAALAGDAATRDLQTGMAPLVYTTPVAKTAYLGGRLLGAFAVSAVLFTAVPFGAALAAQIPGVEAQLVGPFRPAAYLGSFVTIALPNAFIATTILFSIATLTRRALGSYLAGAMLFLTCAFSRELIADGLGRWNLGKLFDPSGFTVISALWRTWTPAQKNAHLVAFDGALLMNRLLWVGIALAMFALARARFRFEAPVILSRRSAAKESVQVAPPAPEAGGPSPSTRLRMTARMTAGARLRMTGGSGQTLAIAWDSFRDIVTSRAFFVLPLMAAALVFIGPELLEADLGTPSLPTTARVLPLLGHSVIGMIVAILTVLYAGELVWRERDARMGELADVTPVTDSVSFSGKFLALGLLLVTVQLVLLGAGVAMQFFQGYPDFELGLYLRVLFGLRLIDALLFAVLAMTVHVVVNQKYVANVVALGCFLYAAFAGELGIGHNLLIYGSGPAWSYTDMNGFGASLGPWLWLKIYWSAWALLLGTLARMCWVRGRERKARFAPVPLAIATVLIAVTGTFIFYNTNVLNAYGEETEKETVASSPRARLTGTKVYVELFPKRGAFDVRGTYRFDDATRNDFAVHYEPRGFTNRGIRSPVVENGTYFEPQAWLPAAGDGEGRERIAFDAVVVTDEDQIAVAPGALRATWRRNGRRFFHYVTDAPIRNGYALFSARYAVREARWHDVRIQVLHHPGHRANVDRIIRGAQASLDYYTRHFGPYPHRQLRFVEYPGRGMRLTSYPGTIMYSEAFAVVNPRDDERDLDLPFAVIAHEMAHQWWGNQLVPARVEGAPLLSESLAWYSAMMVVEQARGHEHLRRLIDMMRREYLRPQSKGGVPLLRATDHFDGYRRGPFAMYSLRAAVGEQKVNAALRRLLQQYGSGQPPLPTSRDLYAQLRTVAPDALLEDLFATRTFWELELKTAHAERMPANGWRVTLGVHARKSRADVDGRESEVAMDDAVEVSVLDNAGAPLHLGKHRIRSGLQTLTITVLRKPAHAALDPDQQLIETKLDDNTREL